MSGLDYSDLTNVPGALGSKRNFRLALERKEGRKRTPSEVERILAGEESYTRFRQPRWRFERRKIQSRGINELWQADLAQTTDLAKSRRDGNPKFVLVVCDTMSRYTFLRPLKNKTSQETANAFRDIFELENKRPKILFTDRGTEFSGKEMVRLLKENNVLHFQSSNGSPHKAALAERRIRHFKSLLFKFLVHKEKKSFAHHLPQFQNLINETPSRVLPKGWSPSDIQKDEAKADYLKRWEWEKEAKRQERLRKPFSFHLHQPVRVQTRRQEDTLTRKAYKGVFSKEIFRVHRRFDTRPHTYKVVDNVGYELQERVYSPELEPVRLGTDEK